jgi:transcriptional regulator with XRE-family HTH domain
VPGTIIRKHRELRNYTQDYVAKQMGISQNAYSKIENNYTQLTVKHVKELSKILEISVLELLRDEFEIHKPNHIQIESVDRDSILDLMDGIAAKLKSKHPTKHEFYPVIMAILQTVDTTVESVH